MNKGKKFFKQKGKKGFRKSNKKLKKKDDKIVNKKAIFNRYKDKQKVQEELAKKRQLEQKLQSQQETNYSESEGEEDVYGQLVSCFKNVKKVSADSDDSSSESEDDVSMTNADEEADEQDSSDNTEEDSSDEIHNMVPSIFYIQFNNNKWYMQVDNN